MTANTRRVPRLLRRYLTAGLAIAVLSAFGAVWLATTTTPSYNQSRADRNAAADAVIIDELMTWAGTHRSWQGVAAHLASVADLKSRRVALVTDSGSVVADTVPGLPHDVEPNYRVDPADLVAVSGSTELQLDPRITGAFALDSGDRARLGRLAADVVGCLGTDAAHSGAWATGRIVVDAPAGSPDCGRAGLDTPTKSEQVALDQLRDLANACLLARDDPPVTAAILDLDDPDRVPRNLAVRLIVDGSAAPLAAAPCLTQARIDQARMWTAPAINVVITDLRGDQRGILDLSPGSKARIALVAGGILLLVLVASTIIVLPTLRGMRRLSSAVDRFAAGDRSERLEVVDGDEVAHLNDAFNNMSAQIAGHEEARRRLLGDIAHELRSPLTNIRGWLEAADDGMEVSDGELRQIILTEARHLQRITADLQLLTNAEAGALPIESEEVNLAAVVDEVIAARRPAAGARGVHLTDDVPASIVLTSDSARLRQVIDNLVANAINHTPEHGSVRVAVTRDRDRVVIAVADSGQGIAEADLPRIFDRFWRGDPSRRRGTDSTGLGLSIVRALVQRLGGTVNVESDLSHGTTFTVVLPTV